MPDIPLTASDCKKYGVSDDFARVITQQAIWSYIEGWPIDSSDGSIRTRYIKDLLQAAENQTPQEHPVLLSPESPSFRLQGDFTALKRLP